MNLKIPAWSAILGMLISVPLFIIEFMNGFREGSTGEIINPVNYYSVGLSILSLILGLLVLYGFVILANKTKNQLLKITSYIAIVFTFVFSILNIVGHFLDFNGLIYIVPLLLIGITAIVMGTAVFKLKKTVIGGIATAVGVMYIIEGAFLLTVILSLFVPFTSIATSILEAILFLRASKKY
jgi:hypothetical protein